MANPRVGSILVVMWTAGLTMAILGGQAFAALDPSSPEVVAAIDRGIAYLESEEANTTQMGAKALIGTALLKNRVSRNHPRVREALSAVQQYAARLPNVSDRKAVYGISLSVIFLCTLDAQQYHYDIATIVRYLESVQMANGAWGYIQEGPPGGDTSITQHVVLAFWEAKQAGIHVSPACIVKATNWLLQTQVADGSFRYMGNIFPGAKAVPPNGIYHSTSAAGLGSVYICADLLRVARPLKEVERPDEDLPSGVTAVADPDEKPVARGPSVDSRLIQRVEERGNQWFRENDKVDPPHWTYYYYYSAERYWTFREVQDKTSSEANRWYDAGAHWVISKQEANGSWLDVSGSAREGGAQVHTSFALLFLLRSTKQAYEQVRGLGAGVLVGGRGLPRDTDSVVMRGGQVISTADLDTLRKMLSQLEDSDDGAAALALEQLAELPAEDLRVEINKHEARLRELVGSGSPEARLAAIRALALARSFENVPILIFALSDPDPEVFLAARDGLRRVSLKFDGFGLSDEPTEDELYRIIREWKNWFLAVRPDATFVD